SGAGERQAATAGLNPEFLERRLQELREVLRTTLDSNGDAFVLRYVSDLLDAQETFEVGVATLEALGDDIAASMFRNLNSDQQRAIHDFMTNKRYSSSREAAMLDAAERLKMISFVQGFSTLRSELSHELVEVVMR